jgi:uncharacterized coiled-coil DUF342 family protein
LAREKALLQQDLIVRTQAESAARQECQLLVRRIAEFEQQSDQYAKTAVEFEQLRTELTERAADIEQQRDRLTEQLDQCGQRLRQTEEGRQQLADRYEKLQVQFYVLTSDFQRTVEYAERLRLSEANARKRIEKAGPSDEV